MKHVIIKSFSEEVVTGTIFEEKFLNGSEGET